MLTQLWSVVGAVPQGVDVDTAPRWGSLGASSFPICVHSESACGGHGHCCHHGGHAVVAGACRGHLVSVTGRGEGEAGGGGVAGYGSDAGCGRAAAAVGGVL